MGNCMTGNSKRLKGKNGALWVGIIILLAGALLFIRQLGVDLPFWLFRWYTILVVIGLILGIRSGFRDIGAVILVSLGMIFLVNDVYEDLPITDFTIPALLLLAGIFIVWKAIRKPGQYRGSATGNPRHSGYSGDIEQHGLPGHSPNSGQSGNSGFETVQELPADQREDIIEVVSIFGSIKKMVNSKNFKGGEIISIFGGSEINLAKAEFTNTVELEVVSIFGGAKLIIPSDWNVRSEANAIFGGVEDKRDPQVIHDLNRTLVIKGSTIFGGIEITSYI